MQNSIKVDRARRKINQYLGWVEHKLGGAIIRHPDIRFDRPALFRGDGVHLLLAGADIFIRDLQQGIRRVIVLGGAETKH